MRLCRSCLDRLHLSYGRHWIEIKPEDDEPLEEVCCTCQAPVQDADDRDACFVTEYVDGERSDYFGWYCGEHADALARELKLT